MHNNTRDKPSNIAGPLENMLEKNVQIVTSDGRIFVGKIF